MTPRWWGTVLYPTALVGIFLGMQLLLGALGVPDDQRATLAALPAVAALLISLPLRLRAAWGSTEPWQALGVRSAPAALARALVRGLLKALLLLALVVVGLALAGQISWEPRLNAAMLLNALALGLGVGFAEELLFRGWLLGELRLLLGAQRALWLQAAVFSLVHSRFNLPGHQLLGLLGGLLLLGLALGLQRRADGWPALGGGGPARRPGWRLVPAPPRPGCGESGGSSLAARPGQPDRRPAGLAGPGSAAAGAAALVGRLSQRVAVARARRPSTGACKASSSGARP